MAHKRLLMAVLAVLGLGVGCGGGGGGTPAEPSTLQEFQEWTDPRLDLGDGDDTIVAVEKYRTSNDLAVVVNRRDGGKNDVWCGKIDAETGKRDENFVVVIPFEHNSWATRLFIVDDVGYVFGEVADGDGIWSGFCFGYDLDDGTVVEQWTFSPGSWGVDVDPLSRIAYTVELKPQNRVRDLVDDPATLTVRAYTLNGGRLVMSRTLEIGDTYQAQHNPFVRIHENRLVVGTVDKLMPDGRWVLALYVLDKPTGRMLGFNYLAPLQDADCNLMSMAVDPVTGAIYVTGDEYGSKAFVSKIGSDLSLQWTATENGTAIDMLGYRVLIAYDFVYFLGGSPQGTGIVHRYTHGGVPSAMTHLLGAGTVRCGAFDSTGLYLGYSSEEFSGVRKIGG